MIILRNYRMVIGSHVEEKIVAPFQTVGQPKGSLTPILRFS